MPEKMRRSSNYQQLEVEIARARRRTELSEYEYGCTYSILESPMGASRRVAALRLTPVTDSNRSFAKRSTEFDCAPEREAQLSQDIGRGVFQAGFDALKRNVQHR